MSVINKRLMFEASEAIYSTVTDPDGWARFLDILQSFAPEIRVILQYRDQNFQIKPKNLLRGYDPGFVKSYVAYYNSVDASSPLMQTGAIGAPQTSTEPDQCGAFFGGEFYNNWITPQDDIANTFGVVLSRGRAGTVFLACHLPATLDPAIVASLHATLDALTPLMIRAVRLSQQLLPDPAPPDPRGLVLDRLSNAVFCLDEAGRGVYANAAADRMLWAGDVLRKGKDDRLHFVDLAADARLHGGRSPGVKQDAASFAVTDRRKGVSLAVSLVTDLTDHHRALSPAIARTVSAMMLISDPLGAAVAPAAMLRSVYGLTRAEATVAEHLARGEPLNRIAELASVKESTIRSQMKSVMEKMGVSRQSDVVRAVLGLAGGFHLPAGSR